MLKERDEAHALDLEERQMGLLESSESQHLRVCVR